MPSSKGLPGDWDGLVVLHAANSYDSVKFADQHMAEALAKLVPVLYVDPPVSFLSPLRRPELRESLKRPRLRLLAPNLARLTPMAPPLMERPGVARVTTALVRRSMAATAEALTGGPGRVRATIATSALVPTLGACRERLRVYWAQDDFVGGAELFGSSAGRIQHGEIHLAAAADIIVASNPTVAATWRDRNRPTELIPFGCDAERFAGTDEAPRAEDVDLPGPIAGFVGHLGDRIQMDLLEAVAESGVSLLLVGPRHARFELARMQRLLARDNVQWVGPKKFEELPSYLRAIDVGLVPYTDSAFNRGSFPLKTLEYLAAGRGVVATDLPAMRWLDTDLIRVETMATGFANAVVEALRDPRPPAEVARRRAFAAAHSWDRRAEARAEVLGVRPSAAEERASLQAQAPVGSDQDA
jgi:teichuronic acid biosynthesis glycosyltransferase TuaH